MNALLESNTVVHYLLWTAESCSSLLTNSLPHVDPKV